jgi:hypothetical protein
LLLGSAREQPFRNLAVNWSHVFNSSLINELLVGYNSINVITSLNDWGGIGNANATYGIPGGQPFAGLSAINWGGGLSGVGAAATLENNLPKGYQLNEKLTWIKGRHALKFGGQFLRYVQRRYYAGNNGALGSFNYAGTFTGFAFSDFLLDQPSRAVAAAIPTTLDAPHQPDLALRPGRLRIGRLTRTWACAGLLVAPSSRRTTAVELDAALPRQRDRCPDLRAGRRH